MPDTSIYSTVRLAAKLTDHVIVGASGGKDSVVTLDLCAQHFPQVSAYFMYMVKGLSFQEEWLRWAENRYGIEIMRIPHFMLGDIYGLGCYRPRDLSVPNITGNDIYSYARQQTGAHWIAAGERIADSIIRRAMIKQSGTIDHKRGRIYPVAGFSRKQIFDYMQFKGLYRSREADVIEKASKGTGSGSFGNFTPEAIQAIRDYYPADFEKIREVFPLVESIIKRKQYFGT
jgi:phosphoadenosine phosphosulfate reductase